ncbi:MAG: DUF4390 domain-containing protein [Methylobacter sp.]|nr:DUF4390 domain-containing protein [Methylobacter sp.]
MLKLFCLSVGVCSLLLCLLPVLTFADKLDALSLERPARNLDEEAGVKIENVETILQDDSYVLSADIDYRLSPRAKEALQNGVPLFWDIHVKTFQHRDYLWDKVLVSTGIRYRIQYHALLNMYRVRDENGGELYNFSTLSAALDSMSVLRKLFILNKNNYVQGRRYAVGIKVTLDRDALPLPLRPVAYTNPQWYLSSDWTLWPFTK